MIIGKLSVRLSIVPALFIVLGALLASSVWAAVPAGQSSRGEIGSGEQLYALRCAGCHDEPVARAPHKIVFSMLGPEYILSALNQGVMQAQAAGLSAQQKILLAEHLGERSLIQDKEAKIN